MLFLQQGSVDNPIIVKELISYFNLITINKLASLEKNSLNSTQNKFLVKIIQYRMSGLLIFKKKTCGYQKIIIITLFSFEYTRDSPIGRRVSFFMRYASETSCFNAYQKIPFP